MPKKTESLIETIKCIAYSQSVIYYKIGLTCRPEDRRKTYGSTPPYYRHFVILESVLTSSQALDLEKEIFEIIAKSKKSSILFKKHAPAHLESYKPSLGGKEINNSENYFLYMTWRSN